MKRAGSLFEIDREPPFEPLAFEEEADGEPGWDGPFDERPGDFAPRGNHDADSFEKSAAPGRRSRLLVAVAAIGAVGFLGSRLTQDTATLSAPPGTAPGLPVIVAAPQALPPARQRQTARPRRADAHRATRRGRTRRAQGALRTPRREPGRTPMASPSRSAVPVPAPAPVTPPPPAQAPAPEPQGFMGEFF